MKLAKQYIKITAKIIHKIKNGEMVNKNDCYTIFLKLGHSQQLEQEMLGKNKRKGISRSI